MAPRRSNHERALDRLREELADDVGVSDLIPAELEEILYATRPHVHERQVPSYGALIYRPRSAARRRASKKKATKRDPGAAAEWREVDGFRDLDTTRMFADGRYSFVVRGSTRDRLRVFPSAVGDELSLAKRTAGSWTSVQRTAGGDVRIFRRNRIVTRDAGSQWWSKPSAQLYREGLKGSVTGAKDRDLAGAVLDLCVHQLSAAGVGATVIQRTFRGPPLRFLDTQHAFELPRVSVLESTNHPAIRSALRQLDRAAIVESSGRLSRLGVTLNSDPEANRDIGTSGGTRHNSAMAYSASEENCIVHVVSSDGPVTVFHNGLVLVSTSGFLDRESEYVGCPACGLAEVDEDGVSVIGFTSDNPDCETCGGDGEIEEVQLVQRSHR